MYFLEVRPSLDLLFKKMAKRESQTLKIIEKKVAQILLNPGHFKPLKKPLSGFRRVHVNSSFVLVYSIDEQRKTVILEWYDHHDRAYA